MSTHCRQCCRPFDTSMQTQAFPPKTCGLKQLKAATMLLGRGSPSKLWAGTSLSPESVETQKWHMKKQRQNVRSTKQKLIADGVSDKIELTWTITKQNIGQSHQHKWDGIHRSNRAVSSTVKQRKHIAHGVLRHWCKLYQRRTNQKPCRSADDCCISKVMGTKHQRGRKIKPNLHILDNEASEAFKAAIWQDCNLQLVPPDTHRRNQAAIQIFKSHFMIANLAGVDTSFPVNLWDRLIPQTVMTLNLLRQSHKNPSILAYQHVNGNFDYNKKTISAIGMCCRDAWKYK